MQKVRYFQWLNFAQLSIVPGMWHHIQLYVQQALIFVKFVHLQFL